MKSAQVKELLVAVSIMLATIMQVLDTTIANAVSYTHLRAHET